MGICGGREKNREIENIGHEEEQIVFNSECKLNLDTVIYEKFRAAIKRYGYAGDLTEKHMQEIGHEIKCDVDEMMMNEKSVFHVVYQDPLFKSQDKRHNVKKLLRLGWLLCKHQNKDMQAVELWHLINPEMDAYVRKNTVMDFIDTLI